MRSILDRERKRGPSVGPLIRENKMVKKRGWLALLGRFGKEAGEYGLHLLGRVAGRAFDLLFFPLLEGDCHREVLLAFGTSKVITGHEVTSLSLSFLIF